MNFKKPSTALHIDEVASRKKICTCDVDIPKSINISLILFDIELEAFTPWTGSAPSTFHNRLNESSIK